VTQAQAVIGPDRAGNIVAQQVGGLQYPVASLAQARACRWRVSLTKPVWRNKS